MDYPHVSLDKLGQTALKALQGESVMPEGLSGDLGEIGKAALRAYGGGTGFGQQYDAIQQGKAQAAEKAQNTAFKQQDMQLRSQDAELRKAQLIQKAAENAASRGDKEAKVFLDAADRVLKGVEDPIMRAKFMSQFTAAKPTPENVYQVSEQVASSLGLSGKEKAPTGLRGEAEWMFPDDPAAQKNYVQTQRAKPGIQVNTGDTPVDPFAKADKEDIISYKRKADEAAAMLPQIETVIAGLENGVETGKIQDMTRPLRQTLNSMGLVVDDNLPAEELVASAMAFMIPRMRVEGSGSTSDMEINLYSQAVPNFGSTTQGNLLKAYGFKQIVEYKRREARLMRQYYTKNKTMDRFDEYRKSELGPLFPNPQTPEEYEKIPKGSVYIHPENGFSVKR